MFGERFFFDRHTTLFPLLRSLSSKRDGMTGGNILTRLENQLLAVREPSSIFLQDNALTHTVHIVPLWLQEYVGLKEWGRVRRLAAV